MQITKSLNINKVNNLVYQQKHNSFLQSWQWGEFQEKVGNKIVRLGIEDKEKLLTVVTLIKKTLPIGMSYFYCPRGPIKNTGYQIPGAEFFKFLISEIEKRAKGEKSIFLRFEPAEEFFNKWDKLEELLKRQDEVIRELSTTI